MTSWADDYRARRREIKVAQESAAPWLGKRRAQARAKYARRKARETTMQNAFLDALRQRVRVAPPDDHILLPVGPVLAHELERVLRALDRVQQPPKLRLVSDRSE
jgi:hypothetical protein